MLTATLIGWMALGMGIVALLVLVAAVLIGVRAWRDLQRVRMTQDVAIQLVDTHAARLQTSVDEASAHVGTIADDGEQLAEHIGELRRDVDHLRWMLARIPEAREQLMHQLLSLAFWTRDEAPRQAGTDA